MVLYDARYRHGGVVVTASHGSFYRNRPLVARKAASDHINLHHHPSGHTDTDAMAHCSARDNAAAPRTSITLSSALCEVYPQGVRKTTGDDSHRRS